MRLRLAALIFLLISSLLLFAQFEKAAAHIQPAASASYNVKHELHHANNKNINKPIRKQHQAKLTDDVSCCPKTVDCTGEAGCAFHCGLAIAPEKVLALSAATFKYIAPNIQSPNLGIIWPHWRPPLT